MGRSKALLFRARERLCAIQVEHVVETMRPLPIERLPDVPPFLLGVSVVRGLTVPVVDAGALVHGAGMPSPTRFVLLRVGGRRVALAVEQVLEVRGIPPASLAELPPLLSTTGGEAVDSIGTLDRELFLMLSGGRLVPDAAWSSLPAPEARP